MNTLVEPTSSLAEKWQAYRVAYPSARIREAAAALGVSEATLLATRCGAGVQRLRISSAPEDCVAILSRVGELGRVMALTRNEHGVHERKGTYGNCRSFNTMGLIQGEEIDLRFFFDEWEYAFAEQDGEGKASLQFFDGEGVALHKIHLLPESDRAAYDRLVEDFLHEAQEPICAVPGVAETRQRNEAPDLEGFRAAWAGMKDPHEFYGLLERFRLGRQEALELIGAPFSKPLHRLCAEPLLQNAARDGVPIMVFVGNEGAIQIHTGPVTRIVPFGAEHEWINILDDAFNLHLRQSGVSQAWLVQKPTKDGEVTSVELFDAAGELIVQFFGKRKPGEPQLETWKALTEALD